MDSNRDMSPQSSSGPPIVFNKNGRLNIDRPYTPRRFFSDLYHHLLSLSWPNFFILSIVTYFLTNLIFALLYFACGENALKGIRPGTLGRFEDCFFFSIQTLATIGYGQLSPSGVWPNLLVALQAFLGMLILATMTSLLYARFSRPTARVIFSAKAIIGSHNGQPCFIFRVANERLNQIVEAHMTLTLTKNEVSSEGEGSRKFYELKLERDYSPLFALSWTVRHFIDAASPLLGLDEKKLREGQMAILASLSGIDETISQTITARHIYTADDIVFNHRFKDILLWQDQKIRVDLKGIHEVQKIH